MTLGERIQELRKQQGMSQEALGEALGVTRQAISKWEGDITIPEVEKLIAMSRLFQVSVGSLLGEEEAAEGSDGEELGERELQAVERIVSRYLAAAEEKKRPRKKWPFVLAALVVCYGVFRIFSWLGQLDSRLNSLDWQLHQVNTSIAYQVDAITAQMEDILSRQNSLMADWSWQVAEVLPREDALVLALELTPKEYTDGLTIQVVGEVAGESYAAQAAHQGGGVFSAQLHLPRTDDEVRLSAVLTRGEEQQTQLLEELYGLRQDTLLQLNVDVGTGSQLGLSQPDMYIPGETVTGTLEWDEEFSFHIQPSQVLGERLYPVEAALVVYQGTELVESRPLALEDGWGSPLDGQPYGFQYTLEVQAGDEVRTIFRVTDNYGQITDFVIEHHLVQESANNPHILDVESKYLNFFYQLDEPFGL